MKRKWWLSIAVLLAVLCVCAGIYALWISRAVPVSVRDTVDGAKAAAVALGKADAWTAGYGEENTLVLEGELGQNLVAVEAPRPIWAEYRIFLPDGTVYDDGTRTLYDSQSPCLQQMDSESGYGLTMPSQPGEYIYELRLCWPKGRLERYGFKVVMTGERGAFDEALYRLREQYDEDGAVTFLGRRQIPDAPSAGECYVFRLENGTVCAVSGQTSELFEQDADAWRPLAD